jgi:hypothetical protein
LRVRAQSSGFAGRAQAGPIGRRNGAQPEVDGLTEIGHFKPMLVRLVHTLHRVVLLAALTVALVGTGFAHRIAAPQDDALAYAMAYGVSLADICGDDLKGGTHAGTDCQACQITAAADLPPLTGVRVDLELAFHASVVAPLEIRAVLREADPANQPQGPPVA